MSTARGPMRTIAVGLAGFSLMVGVVLFSGGSAKAAFADIPVVLPDDPTSLQFINLTNGDNDPGTGSGAYLPNSLFKVYAENGTNSHRINFDIVNRRVGQAKSCYFYKIAWGIRPLDAYGMVNGSYTGGARYITIQGCTLGPSATRSTPYGFTIPAGYLRPQTFVPGHVGPAGTPLYEGFLEMQVFHDPDQTNPGLTDPGEGHQTATLRLSIDGADKSPGDGRIGYFGGGWATTYPAFGSDGNILSTKFRPACDVRANSSLRIRWIDDDYPTARQPENPQAKVYEFDPNVSFTNPVAGGPMPGGPGMQYAGPVYGSGGAGYLDMRMQPNRSYEFRFENVLGANGIRIIYPFDSGDFYLPCPPPQPGEVAGICSTLTVRDDNTRTPVATAYRTRTFVAVVDSSGRSLVNDTNPDPSAANSVLDNGETRTYNYVPSGRTINVNVVRQYYNTSVNRWVTYTKAGESYPQNHTCYSASCTAHFFTDQPVPGRPNGVMAGSNVFLWVNINNTGPLTLRDNLYGNRLTLTGNGMASGYFNNNIGLPLGVSPVPIGTYTAPAGRGTTSFAVRLAYPGFATMDPVFDYPSCTVNIDVYEQFNLVAIAGFPVAEDPENPERITYTNSVDQISGPADGIPATATSRLFYRTLAGAEPPDDLHNATYPNRYIDRTFPLGVWNDTILNSRDFSHGRVDRWQPGDYYCARSQVSPSSGYIGPGDDIADPQTAPPAETCDRVENRPYVRSYMSDVVAGGQFEGSSAVGSGTIKTYNKGASGEIGSGVEFAAEAVSAITGFSSAFLRNGPPLSPLGLSFANDFPGPAGVCSATVPGCFRGGRQVYNYFEKDMKPDIRTAGPSSPPGNSINLNSLEPRVGEQTWYQGGAAKVNLDNPGAGAIFNGRHEIFVDGDVFIRDNIIYSSGPWTNITQIPNLRLIVRGDIYISRNVTQLDGLYVAQPKADGSGGIIHTCTRDADGSFYSDAELYEACRQRSDGQPNKLQVNGSFIAQDINFLRTTYTLSDAYTSCPTPREVFDCDRASESFRLSPDFFLGLPASQPTGGQNNGRYDSIKTLPPIL